MNKGQFPNKHDIEKVILNIPAPAYLKNHQGIYIITNQAYASLLGNSLDKIIGKTDYDLFSTQEANVMSHHDKIALKKDTTCIFEESFVKTKLNVTLLVQKSRFKDVNDGACIYGLPVDISSYKSTKKVNLSKKLTIEKKLRKDSEYALQYFIQNTKGHFYWKDKNGSYLGCNEAVAKAAGLSSTQDIIGKTDYDMPWKDKADILRKIDFRIINTGIPETLEEPGARQDGSMGVFLTTKFPFRDATGKIKSIMGFSEDITERKKIEEEMRLAKEKAEAAKYIMTEFIANMGHDLATPISDIGSIAEVLNYYGGEYPELKDLFETLVQRSADCEAVRKRIINATAISNIKVKNETFSIVSEILILVKELKSLIGSKPLKLIIKPLKPKKEDIIKTDRPKFHAILFDLISNAINFTEEGEVTISVLKDETKFYIKVTDTGIGIPKDKFEYIFEQYTKLARSNQYGSTFKGVGAGLYLARIRANILHATISVESKLHKGSTFTLSIPLLNDK